ncbi:MAG TPA: MG2 domain-containing protein, partial [Pyrinomonadaceae bacterium]|nr:MG2 domain-containing protein [Pyrinomonadaceae bacterium]
MPLTHAGGEIKVDESRTRVLIQKQLVEVQLAIENSTGEPLNATVQLELLDPKDRVVANTSTSQQISPGNHTPKFFVPFSLSSLTDKERRELLWYRLRYRLNDHTGIVSLSNSPDLFELRIVTSETAREGSTYHVRVSARHPITHKPAAKVAVTAELLLDDDDNRSLKLQAAKNTDSEGYALLDFVLPPRFPQFPHTLQSSGGEVKLVGRRGAVVAEAEGQVLVDQLPRTLITPDKPIYQPGQTMHVRALMFTPSRRALANQSIAIRICDPENVVVFRNVVTTSRFGIATVDWPIPENTRLGDYRIWVGVDGEDEDNHLSYNVRISRYDLPNFSVSVDPDRGYYLPGQNAEVRVRADYLFGKPVSKGHVRVVRETEREWNYREQKWDIVEGDKYEGQTDASGAFTAHVDLAADHEDVKDSSYREYKDVTYAAYFTDPTTNRTEQRRFDLRVTREPIHVYVIENYDFWKHNRTLPLNFYVSTFYADGSPARCKVDLKLDTSSTHSKQVTTVRTNRYGLAKVAHLSLPREFKELGTVDLKVSAVDANGRKGTQEKDISLSDDPAIQVETDKTIYRPGEPINAVLTSSVPNQTLFVDLARDGEVIRTQRVQMREGRVVVTFPYRADFRNKISVSAYSYSPETEEQMAGQSVLYPQNLELEVKAHPSQPTYRPGEDAQINLSVQARQARTPQSALGVVVVDKAVDERFRSDQEFGQHFSTLNESLQRFLGLDEQISGVTMRDLQRIDTTKFISPDLELLAEVLLGQQGYYSPRFYGGDQYEMDQISVFTDLINQQIKPVHEALNNRYLRHGEYPKNENELRVFLLEDGIDFAGLRDPWGNTYRADFSIVRETDMLTLMSAGADERFDTADDFSVDRSSWRYFVPVGGLIDRAIQRYHSRTGGFILDEKTLRAELSQIENLLLDQRDRWGQPYKLEFAVVESNYVLRVLSSGPDRKFSTSSDTEDDFVVWTTTIDYFADHRPRLQSAITKNFEATKRFPANDSELR